MFSEPLFFFFGIGKELELVLSRRVDHALVKREI